MPSRREFIAASAAVVAGAALPGEPCGCDTLGLPESLEVTFGGCPEPAAWNVYAGTSLIYSGPLAFSGPHNFTLPNESAKAIPAGAMIYAIRQHPCQSCAPAGE